MADPFFTNREPHHAESCTASLLTELQLQGHRPFQDEPDARPLDGFHALTVAVSKTCLARFDDSKYSVAATAIGRPVEVHAYAERIVIRQDGRIIGDHARCFGHGRAIYDP